MNKLMWRGKVSLLMLFSLMTLAACNDDDDDVTLDELSEEEFVQQAAINNMFEIETSSLALTKAETDEVEQFAQRMIDDHTQASAELLVLASSEGIAVPTTLPQEKQAIANRLGGLTGVAFDKDYMNVQVAAHLEAVALFKQAADELDDAELRAFAAANLPVLQSHLQMALDLKATTDQL